MDVALGSSRRAAPEGRASWEPDRYYRAYWEGAHEGLYVVRCLGEQRFLYEGINPAHERATGLSRAQVVGRSPKECLEAKVAEVVTGHYRACVKAGRPIHYVETLDLPAGRKTWETTLVPVRGVDGSVEVILGSCRDITEAVDAQRELAEGAERLLEVQEEERRRIAQELHDSTSQHLVAVSFGLSALRRGRANAGTLEDMTNELDQALREVRTLSYLLHPPTLAKEGLKKTLQRLCAWLRTADRPLDHREREGRGRQSARSGAAGAVQGDPGGDRQRPSSLVLRDGSQSTCGAGGRASV